MYAASYRQILSWHLLCNKFQALGDRAQVISVLSRQYGLAVSHGLRLQEAGLAEQLQERRRQLTALDVEDLSAYQEERGSVEHLIDALKGAAAANSRSTPASQQRQPQPGSSTPSSALQLAAV